MHVPILFASYVIYIIRVVLLVLSFANAGVEQDEYIEKKESGLLFGLHIFLLIIVDFLLLMMVDFPYAEINRLSVYNSKQVYESLRKENPPSLARESPQLLTRKCVIQTEDHSLSSLCTHLVLLQRLQTREREEQLELYRLRMKQTVWEHAWNYIR